MNSSSTDIVYENKKVELIQMNQQQKSYTISKNNDSNSSENITSSSGNGHKRRVSEIFSSTMYTMEITQKLSHDEHILTVWRYILYACGILPLPIPIPVLKWSIFVLVQCSLCFHFIYQFFRDHDGGVLAYIAWITFHLLVWLLYLWVLRYSYFKRVARGILASLHFQAIVYHHCINNNLEQLQLSDMIKRDKRTDSVIHRISMNMVYMAVGGSITGWLGYYHLLLSDLVTGNLPSEYTSKFDQDLFDIFGRWYTGWLIISTWFLFSSMTSAATHLGFTFHIIIQRLNRLSEIVRKFQNFTFPANLIPILADWIRSVEQSVHIQLQQVWDGSIIVFGSMLSAPVMPLCFFIIMARTTGDDPPTSDFLIPAFIYCVNGMGVAMFDNVWLINRHLEPKLVKITLMASSIAKEYKSKLDKNNLNSSDEINENKLGEQIAIVDDTLVDSAFVRASSVSLGSYQDHIERVSRIESRTRFLSVTGPIQSSGYFSDKTNVGSISQKKKVRTLKLLQVKELYQHILKYSVVWAIIIALCFMFRMSIQFPGGCMKFDKDNNLQDDNDDCPKTYNFIRHAESAIIGFGLIALFPFLVPSIYIGVRKFFIDNRTVLVGTIACLIVIIYIFKVIFDQPWWIELPAYALFCINTVYYVRQLNNYLTHSKKLVRYIVFAIFVGVTQRFVFGAFVVPLYATADSDGSRVIITLIYQPLATAFLTLVAEFIFGKVYNHIAYHEHSPEYINNAAAASCCIFFGYRITLAIIGRLFLANITSLRLQIVTAIVLGLVEIGARTSHPRRVYLVWRFIMKKERKIARERFDAIRLHPVQRYSSICIMISELISIITAPTLTLFGKWFYSQQLPSVTIILLSTLVQLFTELFVDIFSLVLETFYLDIDIAKMLTAFKKGYITLGLIVALCASMVIVRDLILIIISSTFD